MATYLTMKVHTPSLDPALVDPWTPAEELVETFNEWAKVNGMPSVDLVSAEWADT